jgi:hypothetical protein
MNQNLSKKTPITSIRTTKLAAQVAKIKGLNNNAAQDQLDLSFLLESERLKITEVLRKDELLRKKHNERVL